MNTPSNLKEALDAVKREMQREHLQLQQKETALKTAMAGKQELEMSVKTKEAEIVQAKAKIKELDERTIRKLENEIKEIQTHQARDNQKLQEINRESEQAIKGTKRF